MMRLLGQFLKENKRNIFLYLGISGIFFVVFELYGTPGEPVVYGASLCGSWLLVYGGYEFFWYVRKHRKLSEALQRAIIVIDDVPEPSGLLEEDYQRLLEVLYKEKLELESKERISRREMSDYYTMWAHQIKTPIAALRLLIQTNEETEDEEKRSLVREMKMELFKVEQYVEMVLTYLRMESMSSDLVLETYSLDDIIRQAVRKYSSMFIMKKIQLDYEPVGRQALTDERWLVFVVEQVLSNALKYTKKGKVSIYMEGAFLVIEDTGIGIWPEDLPRVFERGFTGYNGRRDKKSTGIGLYLCKSVMDRLEHDIRIGSEVGAGTRVYLGISRPTLHVE